MTRVLLAFDKFKDALSAHAASAAAAASLKALHPTWEIEQAPLADGGEGFARILTQSVGADFRVQRVCGPRGEGVSVEWGWVPLASIPAQARARLNLENVTSQGSTGHVAVIEMALASGLALLPPEERDPWQTTTRGTGEVMRSAIEAGAVAILLGVGGSATHDLGLGALSAMGFECQTEKGGPVVPPIPAKWNQVVAIARTSRSKVPPVFIACDVTNPVLGSRGAAAVYGPQKGLRAEDLPRLEAESERMGRLLCDASQRPASMMAVPGAGAAGGIAFGLMTGLEAELLPGFDLVSDWLDLEAKLSRADLVITGEGRFDSSSLEGKGPGAVASRALALGKQVHVFAGQVTAQARRDLSLHAITPAGVPLAQALREASSYLTQSVQRVFSSSAYL